MIHIEQNYRLLDYITAIMHVNNFSKTVLDQKENINTILLNAWLFVR